MIWCNDFWGNPYNGWNGVYYGHGNGYGNGMTYGKLSARPTDCSGAGDGDGLMNVLYWSHIIITPSIKYHADGGGCGSYGGDRFGNGSSPTHNSGLLR